MEELAEGQKFEQMMLEKQMEKDKFDPNL